MDSGKSIETENNTMLISKSGKEYMIENSVAPIKNQKGEITGVVMVFRDFTEKYEKQKQIQYLSYYDYLTGLYNRRCFEEELMRLDVQRNYGIIKNVKCDLIWSIAIFFNFSL